MWLDHFCREKSQSSHFTAISDSTAMDLSGGRRGHCSSPLFAFLTQHVHSWVQEAGASLQSICSLSLSLGLISSCKKTFCHHCKNSHWPSSNSQPSLTQYWRVWCSGQKHKGRTPGKLWHLQTLFFKLVKDQKKTPTCCGKAECVWSSHIHMTRNCQEIPVLIIYKPSKLLILILTEIMHLNCAAGKGLCSRAVPAWSPFPCALKEPRGFLLHTTLPVQGTPELSIAKPGFEKELD